MMRYLFVLIFVIFASGYQLRAEDPDSNDDVLYFAVYGAYEDLGVENFDQNDHFDGYIKLDTGNQKITLVNRKAYDVALDYHIKYKAETDSVFENSSGFFLHDTIANIQVLVVFLEQPRFVGFLFSWNQKAPYISYFFTTHLKPLK